MDLTIIRDRILNRSGSSMQPEEIDDEINFAQSTYIQPLAKLQTEAQYTTIATDETVPLISIATDIYEITSINDISTGFPLNVPLLKSKDSGATYGARKYGDNLFLQSITAGVVLNVAYDCKLKRLGAGVDEVTTPEIEERWHDLYYLGALALIIPEKYYPLFQDRLSAFSRERTRQTKWLGGSAKIKLREVF